ncbi:MAG: helix-turn-helix domain-containing protein [candidate division WOR-3 bacterium]|nr:helix-turn-helix domain-containing protein [candidate division WOR-3 bacterium]
MHNKRGLFYPVIEEYFQHKSSVRETAKKFNLHYQTVFKWIKEYRNSEQRGYSLHRHYKQLSPKKESLIINLKERYPYLTINQAYSILAKKKIKISFTGLWNIWKRNGYCGFDKNTISNDFTDFIPLSRETKIKLKQAEYLFNKKMLKECAQVLNSITWLPKNELVLKIPDELLNPRRRLEKLIMQFGRIPLPEYIKKVKEIYRQFEKNKQYYSALRAGVALTSALSWYGGFRERKFWTEKVLSLLPSKKRYAKDIFPVYFSLLLLKCGYLIQELKFSSAKKIARYCYRLIFKHSHHFHYFLYNLAVQFINLEDYKTAEKLLNKAAEGVDANTKKMIDTLLAIFIHLLRCDKNSAQKLLEKAEIVDWAKNAQLFRYQSHFALIEGNLYEALNLAKEALNLSTGAGLILDIFNSYVAMASAYACLGNSTMVNELLNKLKVFLKKKKNYRQLLTVDILLHKIQTDKEVLKLPSNKLAWLLKKRGYTVAYQFALKKGLLFYFYRYLFFYPEIVLKRIEKNKPTYLPRAILRLPVFNTEAIVYHINLLGRIIVFRNQKYLKIHLSPKDTAIFLFITSRIYEPEKSLNLNELYRNFWQNKSDSPRLFSHSLVRIKKALKIPAHYLEVKREGGESFLMNHNLYFTTDYQEFEQTLARAKALERAGEWEFARKEFLRAFKLFRGEPFKKNFDNWSVDMRFKILSQFETEAINFAKSCIEHKNLADARKILKKVLKIIPDSEEAKRLLDGLVA